MVESTEVRNFADDTPVFASEKDLNSLINRLEHDSLLAIEWFENNYMKLNQEKYHLLVWGTNLKTSRQKLAMQKLEKVLSRNY